MHMHVCILITCLLGPDEGGGVTADRVSLSVRLTFQAPDRTLTDADVQQSFNRIVSALVDEHEAVQR